MTTAQDQQSLAAYEDGKWYWVEHEGWHGEPPTIAPACYKANCDAWYSHIFSGISTPYLKVLEPCERQAARALPAVVTPVAKIHKGKLTWSIPWPEYSVDTALLTGGHDLYTAAQVLAMGRVPACPLPCGWDGLHKIAVADGAYLARAEWPEDEEGVSVQRATVMRNIGNLIEVCRAMLAAPRPPAAQELDEVVITKNESGAIVAVTRQDDEGRILSVLAESEVRIKPLTDEQIEAIPVWVNFVGLWPQSRKEIVRAIEAAHGITHPTGD